LGYLSLCCYTCSLSIIPFNMCTYTAIYKVGLGYTCSHITKWYAMIFTIRYTIILYYIRTNGSLHEKIFRIHVQFRYHLYFYSIQVKLFIIYMQPLRCIQLVIADLNFLMECSLLVLTIIILLGVYFDMLKKIGMLSQFLYGIVPTVQNMHNN